ncbi:MAG TPA: sigma factor-like helix-turn-helix DNA-binding protein [Pyrinomonadaceae bacterium]|nr:sigma factor-like helix-turn-helix DNA-binding protein [Pyrinomonadaceae bacterium]
MSKSESFEDFRKEKNEILEALKAGSSTAFEKMKSEERLFLKMGNKVALFTFRNSEQQFFIASADFFSGKLLTTRINKENKAAYLAVVSSEIDTIKKGRNFEQLTADEIKSLSDKILHCLLINDKYSLSQIYLSDDETERFLNLIYKKGEKVFNYLQRLAIYQIDLVKKEIPRVSSDELEERISFLINQNIKSFDVTRGYSLKAFYARKFYFLLFNEAKKLLKFDAVSLDAPISDENSNITLKDIVEDKENFIEKIEHEDLIETVFREIITKLPETLRQVCELKLKDRTNEEIATILNISVGKVKDLYGRDLKKAISKTLNSSLLKSYINPRDLQKKKRDKK